MSTAMDTHRHNQSEAKKFRHYLRAIPKVVVLYAADAAITAAMYPQRNNYSVNEDPKGNKMVHDTSNAAWNWRIGLDGNDAPPIYKRSYGGEEPLGQMFGKRGLLGVAVVDVRRERDINRKLYKRLFSDPMGKLPQVSLYNNLEDLHFGAEYVRRANLNPAKGRAVSYAKDGVRMAEGVVAQFMQSGAGLSPAPEQLLNHVSSQSSSNFFSWSVA